MEVKVTNDEIIVTLNKKDHKNLFDRVPVMRDVKAYFEYLLDLDYEELRRTYVHGPEICQVTLPQALYCFLISTDFEDCLRTTISIGGDCDTTAAISCAIAEAFYKNIDENLIKQVRNKLTKEMLDVIDLASKKVEEQ